MSVADPVIDHLDTSTKLIYLATDVREYHPVTDLYHEVRYLRATTESLQNFMVPVTAAGAVSKGGGLFTERYAIFNNGWRLVPEDTSHTLAVTGQQVTQEGGGGPACFDFTPLSAGTTVVVNYQPSAAEIITLTDTDVILIRKILQNRVHTNPATGVMSVYDDNDVDVLLTANLYEDVAGLTMYGEDSARIDRRNKLAAPG